MASHSTPDSLGVWSLGVTQAHPTLQGDSSGGPLPQSPALSLAAAPHLLHLEHEGVSQVSRWLGWVPRHPVLSDQLVQQGHEVLLS